MSGPASPDQAFLEMMSDHHKGLITIVHETIEQNKGTPVARADAMNLDRSQDAELDTMVTMLETKYHDPYGPENKAMAERMKRDEIREIAEFQRKLGRT